MARAFENGLTSVRSNFGALRQNQVFMDNAGGSQVLNSVVDAIRDYLLLTNVQLGASYPVSQSATRLVSEGFAAAAGYVNAESARDIVIGGSTTQLFHNVASALLEYVQPGDEFVLSELDHEANIAPWVRLASIRNGTVRWWRGDSDSGMNPVLNENNLRPLLGPRTKFVACTHTSNILGTIHDIRSISAVVREVCPDALLCVDGVAFAPHRAVDVRELGVDFYAFSWYKVYGPHISMLYASTKGQKAISTLGHYFKQGHPEGDSLETKLGLAAYSYELTASLPKVVEYIQEPIRQDIPGHEEILQELILNWLRERADVTIVGHPSSDNKIRVPVISFLIKGWRSKDFVEQIEKRSSFGIRWGHFYTHRLVSKRFGLGDDGVIRISLVHYNTEEEVRGLLKVFDEILD